jgi:hypothetical protein
MKDGSKVAISSLKAQRTAAGSDSTRRNKYKVKIKYKTHTKMLKPTAI